jgi:DNA polymerase-3 subunit epsilon
MIKGSIKNDTTFMKLPPNLNKEDIDRLPDQTGVYYFHNEKGNIIYIGKSNNIRKRALSHFAEKKRKYENTCHECCHPQHNL